MEDKMSPKMACWGSHSQVYHNAPLLERGLITLNPPACSLMPMGENYPFGDKATDIPTLLGL